MGTLKYFFWFWFPAPRIGDEYLHESDAKDPWNENKTRYRVLDRRGNYYRVKFGCLSPDTKHRKDLVAFYVKQHPKT